MSSVEAEETDELPTDMLDTLLQYEEALLSLEDEIKLLLDSTVQTDKKFNNLDKVTDNLGLILSSEIEEDDIDPLINGFLSAILNYNPEVRDYIVENSEGEEIVDFISDIQLKYGIDLEQRVHRLWKGQDWWSNIKTNIGTRSSNVIFTHELTVDYERELTFNSNIETSIVLMQHLLRQIKSAKNILGEDIFTPTHKAQFENLEEEVKEVHQDIEDHLEKYEDESGEEASDDAEATDEVVSEEPEDSEGETDDTS